MRVQILLPALVLAFGAIGLAQAPLSDFWKGLVLGAGLGISVTFYGAALFLAWAVWLDTRDQDRRAGKERNDD
jgi:Na+/H+ antiporter NhaD/arsenite permease-like protein